VPNEYSILSQTQLSRRGFVQSVGLAAGGLVVGLVPAGCARQEPPTPLTAADVNAYIRISSNDEVSIVVPGAELGQGIYTSLPKIVAEELEADWDRVVVRLAHADAAFVNPKKDSQTTGNSDAIVGYFDALRKTGAATREMLIAAAAMQWGLPPAECRAKQGRVVHTPSGQSLGYGELAEAASQLPVPEDPPLKPASEYRLLGKPLPRKDTPMKVDGRAKFGADIRLDNQLFASIKTAPMFGGRVKSYQADQVETRPGVVKVVEIDNGIAVVAESFWEADSALNALEIEFELEPNNTWDSEQISATFHDALDNGNARAFPGTRGDAPGLLAAADEVFEATYEVPFLAHVCMEPMVATAQVTADACNIWAPHQQPGASRSSAAELTGLPLEQVSFQGTFCGGGFGRKWELDFVHQAVKIAQSTEGRPVTLIWTREEDIRHDYYRPALVSRNRAVLSDSGELLGVHTRIAGPSILTFQERPRPIPDPTLASAAISRSYQIPNKLLEFVETNTHVPIGFWRSVALSHNGFIGESVIDELAHRAGSDPMEFRLALVGDNPRARAVLEKAATEADWGKTLATGKGMGVAFCPGFGSFNAQIAEVTVDGDQLTVDRITCVHDCGFAIDPDNVTAQMQGGVVDGLSAALFGKVTIADGAVQQSNFHDYRFIRMSEVPEIDIHLIYGDALAGGVGEAAVPAAGPAVCNAIFAATGKRIRRLPIIDAGFRVS
jgi:isoquinoline 1-oxidoreductase beta subunit